MTDAEKAIYDQISSKLSTAKDNSAASAILKDPQNKALLDGISNQKVNDLFNAITNR